MANLALFYWAGYDNKQKTKLKTLQGEMFTYQQYILKYENGEFSNKEPGCYIILHYKQKPKKQLSKFKDIDIFQSRDMYKELYSQLMHNFMTGDYILIKFVYCNINQLDDVYYELNRALAKRKTPARFIFNMMIIIMITLIIPLTIAFMEMIH